MRVLIAGLGGIGQRHLRNLRLLMGSEVDVIAYRVRNRNHVLTERFEIEAGTTLEEKYQIQTYDDLEEALAQKPSVAFVCNPSSLHMGVATAAARAGCHILIEKPLSHTYDGVDELAGLVETNGLVAMVGYQMRFHPSLRRLRSLLVEQTIGRVLAVRIAVGDYIPGWHPYEDYRQLYASRSDLGGGVILSQIHELDYVYWLFGLPRRVFTLAGKLSRLDIDVEDTASIMMECSVGGQAVPVHVHADYLQRPPTRTCEVIGDTGKIFMDLTDTMLQVFDGDGHLVQSHTIDGFQRNQLFLDELTHFFSCVAGTEKPIASLRDGAQSLRMALAAKESMDTGRVVELN